MAQPLILCTSCGRLISGSRKCKAYPGGIPPEIWNMEVNHSKPYIGDNGLQFKVIEEIEIKEEVVIKKEENPNNRFIGEEDIFI